MHSGSWTDISGGIATLGELLPLESWQMECDIFVQKSHFGLKYGLSWTNRYAHDDRSAILRRMMVSKVPKLDSEAKMSKKMSKSKKMRTAILSKMHTG